MTVFTRLQTIRQSCILKEAIGDLDSLLTPTTEHDVIALITLYNNANRLRFAWVCLTCVNCIFKHYLHIMMFDEKTSGPDYDSIMSRYASNMRKWVSKIKGNLDRGAYEMSATKLANISDPEIKEYAMSVFPSKEQVIHNMNCAARLSDRFYRA